MANVLHISRSRTSELQRTVQGYKQRDMILYDMNMRTVSVASSFRAATADGANALLLIPRAKKEQMGRRLIEPPRVLGRHEN